MHKQISQYNFVKSAVFLAAALVIVLSNICHAEKMSSTIQEAIYTFEMKGDNEKALQLLQKALDQGDKQDKETAFFYLGKIQELSGNNTSASFYYQQSLKNTSNTKKSYWLADRYAATNTSNEGLLKQTLSLESPLKKVFADNPTYLLLENNRLKKIVGNTIVPIVTNISAHEEILHVNNQGIWYQNESKDSLFFKNHSAQNSIRSYPIRDIIHIISLKENTLVQTKGSIILINKKGIKAQINERYMDCSIEGYYRTTNHFVLNCPDNSLHFLSAEDASESFSINEFDNIQKVLIDKQDIILLSGGSLYCYQPKNSAQPKWKVALKNAEQIIAFENRIVVLEASGWIHLLNKDDGKIVRLSLRSDADEMHPLARGTLGLFTSEGALTVVDTLLRPIWNFNFAKSIAAAPIYTDEDIFLTFDKRKLQGISALHYGKQPLLSEKVMKKAEFLVESTQWDKLPPVIDSLLTLEPGNAEAWLFRALLLEQNNGSEKDRQKAWTEAVRLSISNPQMTSFILSRYSKAIKAKFVSLLNISPKTKYPQFFGNKKALYTVDPAAERLLSINAETGELKHSKSISKMDNSPVMDSDENSLAVASGFSLFIHDLNKDIAPLSMQLPGKAFNILISGNAVYVSTWNGFLLKVSKNDGRMAWSRKIFSVPFIFNIDREQIHLASLEGEIIHIWEGSGQVKNQGPRLQNGISQMVKADSALAIATNNNRLYLYNISSEEKEPIQILMESPIASMQSISYKEKPYLILGMADQSILLYSTNGAPIWKFQGKNSIFTNPVVHDGIAWIDQGNEVVGISLADGKIQKRYNTPGGAGTPFIINNTLYSASSKRLLYGFSL